MPEVVRVEVRETFIASTWKTLLPVEKNEEAVVAYLRSPKPVSLIAVETARKAA